MLNAMDQEPRPAQTRRPYQTPRLEDLGTVREATQAGGTGNAPDGPNYPAETS